jgi:DNA-binding beta-propeller fold protein YncE
VIDTATNQVVGSPIEVEVAPEAIAITPDQAPVAAFTHATARPGVPASFVGASSRDPDGSIARFEWDFGDGQAIADGGPAPSHTYVRPGSYRVTLTLTDNEGCSTSLKFTGQTAFCNESTSARLAHSVSVAYPAIRVRCPKRAGPGSCRYRLTAVSKRRRGKTMTKVAKAKVKAGRSKVVSLRPKRKFAARLAAARKPLIREKVTIDGAVETRLRRLSVVG